MLVGGLGTRLAMELRGLPKPMVEIGDRPFLEHVLLHLREFGICRITLAVSYCREVIEERFRDGKALGMSIKYSRETQRLGTAGALRNALPMLRSDEILVLNGDSFADVDYNELLRLHAVHGHKLTLAAVHRPDCRDFGRLLISEGRVLSFLEKQRSDSSPGYINAGVYVFSRELIQSIQDGIPRSLETEFFPSLLDHGQPIDAYCTSGYFVDMGTPERLRQLRSDFHQGLVPWRGTGAATMPAIDRGSVRRRFHKDYSRNEC